MTLDLFLIGVLLIHFLTYFQASNYVLNIIQNFTLRPGLFIALIFMEVNSEYMKILLPIFIVINLILVFWYFLSLGMEYGNPNGRARALYNFFSHLLTVFIDICLLIKVFLFDTNMTLSTILIYIAILVLFFLLAMFSDLTYDYLFRMNCGKKILYTIISIILCVAVYFVLSYFLSSISFVPSIITF